MIRAWILCSGILAQTLNAHEDLNSVIRSLSQKIRNSPTAELYYQRGIEYRAAREKLHARTDFQSALKINPTHQAALRNLALLHSQAHEHKQAIAVATALLDTSPSPQTHLLLADIFYTAKDLPNALKHVQLSPPEEDHTHLLHAHLLQDDEQVVAQLKRGHEITKSIVLRNAWIDALIATENSKTALPIIEKELTSSRFRASWLIRRARVLRSQNQKEAAKRDLLEALTELQKRISPTCPDLTLIYDRGLAYALLDRKKEAQTDLEILTQSRFSPLSYQLLVTLLR